MIATYSFDNTQSVMAYANVISMYIVIQVTNPKAGWSPVAPSGYEKEANEWNSNNYPETFRW